MKTFLRQQLETFLRAVDAALDERVEVVVIGGSAVMRRTRSRASCAGSADDPSLQ
jgi:uridylate kinase